MNIVEKCVDIIQHTLIKVGALSAIGRAVVLAPKSERAPLAELVATTALAAGPTGLVDVTEHLIVEMVVLNMQNGLTREEAEQDAADFLALVLGNVEAIAGVPMFGSVIPERPEDFG